jgi:hypothetical protein
MISMAKAATMATMASAMLGERMIRISVVVMVRFMASISVQDAVDVDPCLRTGKRTIKPDNDELRIASLTDHFSAHDSTIVQISDLVSGLVNNDWHVCFPSFEAMALRAGQRWSWPVSKRQISDFMGAGHWRQTLEDRSVCHQHERG